MLAIDWFYSAPLDFEHKNYLLLSYLSELDSAYSHKKLSPYLLWTQKLIEELNLFTKNYSDTNNKLKREIISFDFKLGIIRENIEFPTEFATILEVVDYSKPLLISRVDLGYKLYSKFPQFLY
jgi:hypothetical protein